MAREFVINTSRVNSYGTRVLTSGIDTEQFKRNPVLLYMHRRDRWDVGTMVIGRVENLRVEGDSLIGTPVFDLGDKFAAEVGRKWEDDFLRMCSAGLEPIEFSSAPEHVAQGQTRATITKSKLIEVSIVDIGANDDALKLYEPDGKVITLAAGEPSDLLPLLNPDPEAKPAPEANKTDNSQINFSMERILLALGLAATASESDALAAITKLQTDAARVETIENARIEAAVDAAITARKITADKRESFIALGKAAGFDHLGVVLDAMTPVVKPLNFVNPGSGSSANANQAQTYAQMSEESLMALRNENPEEFVRLFKAEYGVEPDLSK